MTEFRGHALPGVIEIIPPKFGDQRGFFSEVFKQSAFAEQGVHIDWVQENQSYSADAGTVRGLHFQAPPFAQAKLIRVLRGGIFDVAVDIRIGSPDFGKWVAVELSAEKWNQLLIPAGFAHGFMTLADDVEVLYKVSAPYSRESEGSIHWDDPDIRVVWPVIDGVTLSKKDAAAPFFREMTSPFYYESR
jgi:dTDP-4-dehydrorhamnose 3,5-epimerase